MPLTREDIARLTGTTLFTVSRLMADWEEAGTVRKRSRKGDHPLSPTW
jgi:CRP-like cAMP-binding protein